ncbi:MAG: hypothetical protein M3083_15325 [Actinomycetota bacterium]|nr:hypothetical protein [Actinomycetota bacterium]
MTADPTNRDRSAWANMAVEAFAAATNTTAEDLDTKVGDLLADLHHLCKTNGVSFARCLERADAHYRAEIDDEDPRVDPVASAPEPVVEAAARQYADLFNATPMDEIDRLIADACVDPLWDDRTNLLSLLADEPQDQGLVLASDAAHYAVIRWDGQEWIVDSAPVDWDALEDRAFGPDEDPREA